MFLNKEQILAIGETPKVQTVTVPGVGEVCIRIMSGTERDSFEQSMIDGKRMNLVGVRGKLLARVLCDDAGKRLFTDADADALGNLPAPFVEPIFAAAQKLNALSSSDVEDLVKNSGSGPASASG